ncbi:hypothetical protein K440DRAFT_663031 [Wilcoxina mikolae CBS 423.85]|nr:hypothetical protein K440DRAFT_663031 [Wilcoxina mikolae CBS 423.85]
MASSSSLPRRSSTLFEKSTTSVRRLARKISLSVLNPRERSHSRPSSVATVRSEVPALPERPRSRLARWRSSRPSGVSPPAVVQEEAGEELIRSATPRGFGVGAEKRKDVREVKIPWSVPKARVFRQVRGGGHAEYDVSPLVYGRKTNELWFPTGDTLIYLCAKSESHRYQPSFKVSASTLRKKSEFFTTALSERWQEHSSIHRQTLAKEGARYILYFPPWESGDETREEDSRKLEAEVDFHDLLNQLVATRNFFAYLFGRPAAYLEEPLGGSLLSDFMDRMEMYVLGSNADIKGRPTREQTLREIELWIRSKEIDDTRKAPHKIIDTLLISERYQWSEIYTESFIHAAGRYNFISTLSDFTLLSPFTRQLLERASYSIKARVRATEASLTSFSFPIFSSSRPRKSGKSRRQRRSDDVNMEIPPAWRRSYSSFRKWVIQYYTAIFRVRSWPPAHFSRGMILSIQIDFKALFDLLVDESPDRNDQYRRLLSQVLTDFDPTIPGPPPLPRLPALPPEGSPLRDKQQSREAISVVLLRSYNLLTTSSGDNKFVEAFKEFERAYGAGRVVTKSVEAREGRWCLVVAVLATLKGVLEEWEGLKYGWGVDDWLCAELEDVPPWSARRGSGGVAMGGRGRGRSISGFVTEMDVDDEDYEDEDEEEEEEPVRRPTGRSVFG